MNKIYVNADDFGVSKSNTENLLELIKLNKLNSISVMVNQHQFEVNNITNLNIKIKLHLNLTTSFTPQAIKNPNNLKNSSFLKLLLMISNKKKQGVKDEIEYQINLFKSKFKVKQIYLDSHHHVHMIPWIHNYLVNNFDEIVEIRNSAESIKYFKIKYINNLKIFRNLIAVIVLKLLKIFHQKKENIKYINFCGLLFSGIINLNNLKYQLNVLENLEDEGEIGLHPGKITILESNLFNKRDSKELCSINRNVEKQILSKF